MPNEFNDSFVFLCLCGAAMLKSVAEAITCLCRNSPVARKESVPGHALHEKGLQRQIGVGTLVNSQQRRAFVVPVINRW